MLFFLREKKNIVMVNEKKVAGFVLHKFSWLHYGPTVVKKIK